MNSLRKVLMLIDLERKLSFITLFNLFMISCFTKLILAPVLKRALKLNFTNLIPMMGKSVSKALCDIKVNGYNWTGE